MGTGRSDAGGEKWASIGKEPVAEQVTGLGTFRAATDGVEHRQLCPFTAATESHPVRHVQVKTEGHGFDAQAAHTEESPAEDHPVKFFLEELGGEVVGQSGRQAVACLDAEELRRSRQMIEAIKVERATHGFDGQKPFVAAESAPDGHAEQSERYINGSDGAERSGDKVLHQAGRAARLEGCDGFLARDLRLQAGDDRHRRNTLISESESTSQRQWQ